MSNTKKVTISLTPEQQEKLVFYQRIYLVKKIFPGLLVFLIERWEKEQKKSTNVKSKRSGSKKK